MKLPFNILFIIILLFLVNFSAFSQISEEKSALEKRKNETIQQIEYTRKLLNQTRQSAQLSLNQLNLLSRNISTRQRLIEELDAEINMLNSQIINNRQQIAEIERNISSLIKEYEKMIIAAYKNLDQDNYLEYILGAQDINQGYQRIRQIKYINEYRKKIYIELIEQKGKLYDTNIELTNSLKQAADALRHREQEFGLLSSERNEKQVSVNRLQRQESQLLSELKEKQNIQRELEREISRLIEEEIRRAKAANVAVLTPADILLSGDFVNNMGRLPWPVEKGVITGHFGEHNHPVIKGIKVTSNGIDISTVEGEKARSVFDGEIRKIIALLGANYTVIIKHGEFYTVYTNLININVKVGDMIRKNDSIGTIYTDKNKTTRLHFQIYRDKTLQDPEKWLAK